MTLILVVAAYVFGVTSGPTVTAKIAAVKTWIQSL
jgi:hypothetical protein